MADTTAAPATGQIGWVDLTVPSATALRDFYQHVTGCTAAGGKQRSRVRTMPGAGRYCVIEDPAGAVAALFQPA